MTLQIKNWSKHYEIAKSKQVKHLSWVAIPNRQGIKYTRLIEGHKNGVSHFGVFIAIVQLLSQYHIDTRHGYLTENGSKDSPDLPLQDIAHLIRMPLPIVKEAIDRLKSPNIAWIIDGEYLVSTERVPKEYPTDKQDRHNKQDTPENCKQLSAQFYEKAKNLYPERYRGKIAIDKGAEAIHQLLYLDGQDIEAVERVIMFALVDDFWSKNLISLNSLRKKRNGVMKFINILASEQKNGLLTWEQVQAETNINNPTSNYEKIGPDQWRKK